MSALPLFCDVRFQAIREKRKIVCEVMFADDSVGWVSFGPRGGWKIIEKRSF